MRGHTRTGLRIGAYVASGALALSGAVAGRHPGRRPRPTRSAGQPGSGLAGRRSSPAGVVHNPNFGGFDDYGLTSTRPGPRRRRWPRRRRHRDRTRWTTTSTTTSSPSAAHHAYAGRPREARRRRRPRRQQRDELRRSQPGHGAGAARPEHQSGLGPSRTAGSRRDQFDDDAANVLGQSYAAQGCLPPGAPRPRSPATSCSSSSAQPVLPADVHGEQDRRRPDLPVNTDDRTPTPPPSPCLRSPRIELTPMWLPPPPRRRAWLVSPQRCDGSWGGGTSTRVPTPTARVWPPGHWGHPGLAQAASGCARARQPTTDVCDELPRNAAPSPTTTRLTTGRTDGITDDDQDQWRRATAQAAPGDRLPPERHRPRPTTRAAAPGGYLKEGTRRGAATTGVAAGDRLCVSRAGARSRAPRRQRPSSTVTLPAGTATRTYTVTRRLRPHRPTRSVKVLGAKTLDRRPVRRARSSAVRISRSPRARPGRW